MATGFATGLAPALRAAAASPNDLLKSTQPSGTSRPGRRSRAVLVTAEIALSLALLIVAGLLVQSFARLTAVDTGFRADHVLLAQVSLPSSGDPPDRWPQFFERALGEIRTLPGVEAAGAGAPLPLSGQRGLLRFGVRFEGRPEPAEGQNDRTYLRWVTADYFRAMGIPLLHGRAFSDADRADTAAVAVIDQSFADRYFPGENPVGKRARTTNSRTFREIVGVVGNVRQTSLDEPPEPHFYVAHLQSPSPVMTFVVRSLVEPEGLSPAVRQAIRRVDPTQAIYNVRTLAEVTSGSVASQRFNASLLALFAALAVTLTLVGVYGLTAHWVSGSTREIGVRMALGASRHEVVRLIVGRGLRVSVTGAALGILIGLAAAQFLGGLLYGVKPVDLPTFAAATIVVMAASMTASYLPVRRALAIDPSESLRD
jgi:putative ABC transport system permease protein